MFGNNKKIKELEEQIREIEQKQHEFIKYTTEILKNTAEKSKENYMWEIREEEINLIEDGVKLKKIRKLLT